MFDRAVLRAGEVIARIKAHLDRRQLAAENSALLHLHGLSYRLVSKPDLPTLLQAVVDTAAIVAGSPKGTLQQRAFLEFFAVVDGDDAAVCGEAWRRGDRVVVEDVASSPIFRGKPAAAVLADARVKAVQSTPLRTHDGRARLTRPSFAP